jgi:lipopolysaccharide export system permease protein
MIIFRYILGEYTKYVIGTIALTVFLFVLFDFIHKSSKEFAERPPASRDVIEFYVYQIPAQAVQAAPIAGLLASVVAMILLNRTNEVTALRAVGMGPRQIAAPLAVGGLVLSSLSFLLSETVVPRFANKVHFIQEVRMRGGKEEAANSQGKWQRFGQNLYSYRDYDPIAETVSGVQVIEVKPNFRPVSALHGDFARFDRESGQWTVYGLKELTFRRTGLLEHIEYRGTEVFDLPLDPRKLRRDRRKPSELSFFELNELLERGEQSGADILPFRVELHGKFAYPLSAFVVSLIGVRFGFTSERTTETAKGVLWAFFLGISYWIVLSAARALGLQGHIHPMLGAWLPNFVVLAVISFEAYAARRGR